MFPPEFEGLYALFEGRYWAVHDVDEGGWAFCTHCVIPMEKYLTEYIHMSKLEWQYARKTR